MVHQPLRAIPVSAPCSPDSRKLYICSNDEDECNDLNPNEVIGQLKQILRSPSFSASPKLKQFLLYVVDCRLRAPGHAVKEYMVGRNALSRGDSFDPKEDPIVRVYAGRLRKKLHEYYSSDGAGATVLIELPKGKYVPILRPRTDREGLLRAG